MSTKAFLGVENSLGNRRWIERPGDARLAQALSQRFGLPEIVGRVMAARGVGLEGAQSFLSPTLRDLMPDPSHLLDMDVAAGRIARAVTAGELIGVFGDYDVDGATSSALLSNYLRSVGGVSLIHIPDRVRDGYGPNLSALLDMKSKGCAVVVTVDCGVTAFQAVGGATEAGLDMVIVDHHAAEPLLPKALAVVNPNRVDETSAHGYLAAVGVTFLLVAAVQRALKKAGWFGPDRPEPDLLRHLDIVALGTVCDVVPLVGVNRALVTQGLKVLAGRSNPGLAALSDVAKIAEAPDAYHLGYVLGPRVNAGGRIGQSSLGADLLSSQQYDQALVLAHRLDAHNRDRQEMEAAMLLAAMEQAEGRPDDGMPLVTVDGVDWHPGIVGLIASRLKERYGCPACAVAFDSASSEAIGKGSGRSVPGLDLGAAIIAARQQGLLVAGGGHAMAAGFTVRRDRYEPFKRFLAERLGEQQTGDLTPILELDGALECGGATVEIVETLRRLGPFGSGNAEPKFAVINARVVKADVVGQGHVRCFLAGSGGQRLKAIAFRAVDDEIGQALLTAAPGAVFHFAGSLRVDTWGGNTQTQLIIDDMARP